ncbi:MAG: DUF1846 domain-containing protein [Eubacteriales bacterium]|nr:DUF1846 domain-containing protein [Eubacteriales bacterium]MDD4327697.1 DUF1846 domain-containing protein [Eubacteriales bacterium]
MFKPGFNNDKYIELQSEKIRERIAGFGGKLYLEFGGKLFDDYHASRVLPGFEPDSKVNMLMKLSDQAEIIIAINASDIQKSKFRGDFNIPYEQELLRLIDAFRESGLYVGSVVITQFSGQPDAQLFENRLVNLGIRVYHHYPISGYPYDISKIVSDEGCGKNEYIETTRPLVVVTAPGPGSGKMAVCLSQLYHDNLRGIKAGYAKFETFPIWNLPLKHSVNLAYEAATADLNDVNMIDPFHLEAYNVATVNYNRDVEIFPVLKAVFDEIYGECPYKSPTDMGVNMAGFCITDNDATEAAAQQEIIRRYYKTLVAKRKGFSTDEEVMKVELIMKQLSISTDNRQVVAAALSKQETTGMPASALELPDGRLVTGKTTSLLGSSAALLLNAIKTLGNINDDIHLISPVIIEPIQDLKINHLGNSNPRLHTDEVLVALSISAATNPTAKYAMDQLQYLRGCEAHSTVILSQVDDNVFQKLGINLTSEPRYQTKRLYHK